MGFEEYAIDSDVEARFGVRIGEKRLFSGCRGLSIGRRASVNVDQLGELRGGASTSPSRASSWARRRRATAPTGVVGRLTRMVVQVSREATLGEVVVEANPLGAAELLEVDALVPASGLDVKDVGQVAAVGEEALKPVTAVGNSAWCGVSSDS